MSDSNDHFNYTLAISYELMMAHIYRRPFQKMSSTIQLHFWQPTTITQPIVIRRNSNYAQNQIHHHRRQIRN